VSLLTACTAIPSDALSTLTFLHLTGIQGTDSASLHSSFQLPKSCLSGESARARTTLNRDPWRGLLDNNNIHPLLHSRIHPALSSSLRLTIQQLFVPPCNAPSCALLPKLRIALPHSVTEFASRPTPAHQHREASHHLSSHFSPSLLRHRPLNIAHLRLRHFTVPA
jgi:hypothetical protein